MFKINNLLAATLVLVTSFCINTFGYASAGLEVEEENGTYRCTLPLKWVEISTYSGKLTPLIPNNFTEIGTGEYLIPFSYTPADEEEFSFEIPTGFPMAATLAMTDLLSGKNIEKHSRNPNFGVAKSGNTINLKTREKLGTYRKELADSPLEISKKLGYVFHLLKTTANQREAEKRDIQASVAVEPSMEDEIQVRDAFVKRSFKKLSQKISRNNSMGTSDIRRLFSKLKDFSVAESDQRDVIFMITAPSGKKFPVKEHPRKNASGKVRNRYYTEQVTKILNKENIDLKN